MELCPYGDLFNLLHEQPDVQLSWRMKLKIAQNIGAGVAYMHDASPSLVHVDLKSPNVLVYSLNEHEPVIVKVCHVQNRISYRLSEFRYPILGSPLLETLTMFDT